MRQGLVRLVGGAAMLALIGGAAACNSTNNNSAGGGSTSNSKCGYEIAFFGALTGSAANLGVNIEQGAELAVDQYNDKNGANCITMKKFDSQGDPAVAPGVARQLIQDKKIIGIVGPAFSGESIAANPIFDQAGIPLITPSATNPVLASGGKAGGTPWKVFHRAVANDDAQGPAAGLYIKEILKPTKVFVIDDQSAYGAGLADAVKQTLGSLVVNTDKVAADGKQTDFSSSVTKVVSSGATVLFYGGYYQNAGLLRKQLTAAGWKGTLVAGDGVNDPGYIKAAGNAAAQGTVLTCPCAPASQASGTFDQDYKAKWNVDAGTYSDVAYDATNIFLQGITAGNTTTAKMNTYLSTVDYKGVANEYKFQTDGDLDTSLIKVWAFKVDNGQVVPDQAAPTS
ncbi:MAG TPA: branched-chain amino acid ABC transporter substrate-binding protein [Micromonosporaceae bacterium]|nr:branched-chain amino acid ABC transporter substrate-binding protein [Micromonosporaceae bacterium]